MDAINPYREMVAGITPLEFEKVCYQILDEYAHFESLKDFEIIHDEKIKADDGVYQIDVYAEFTALSVRFKVIGECKRYSRPIEREKVVALADKARSLGAHKAILMSTSGFQSGACEYAKKHGVALIQIFNDYIMHVQNSISLISRDECERNFCKYSAYLWGEYLEDFPDTRLYPGKCTL